MLLIITNSLASAKTYYVSTSGKDSNVGSISHPWLNWSKAFHTAQAGDTVFFRGGTYSTDVTDGLGIQYYPSHGFGNDGTADNPICYFNYPGEIPILDCTGTYPTSESNSVARALYLYGVDYAHIKGLQIKGVYQRSTPGSTGSYDVVKALDVNYCDHVKLENMVVSNVGGKAIQLLHNYYIEVINCDAYDCCDYYHKSMPGNYGGGISVNNLEFDNGYNYIYGCRAWRCSDQGLCAGGSRSLAIFENCWSFDNGKIDGNITGEGHGIKIGQMYSTSTAPIQCIVTNCVFSKNGRTDGIGDGITTNDNYDTYAMSIHVYNNFVYQSGRFGFVAYNTVSPDEDELKRIFKNNVSYESYNTNMYLAPNALYTHSNNSWDHTVTVTDEDFLSLDHSQLYRPRKADGSLPDITFGRLAAGSDLIAAGVNVGLPFNGKAPDLGAFEYSEQPSNLNPSVTITSPSNGSTFITPVGITIVANSSDPDGTIAKVEFFNGAVKLGEKTSSPWSFTWNNVQEGTYSLIAVATDNQDAKTTSSAVSVTVNDPPPATNQPPLINITNPITGSTYSAPANITLTANASDAEGLISKVEFFNGATKLGEKTSSPWSFVWNNIQAGTYSITAVATDNSAAKTTSAAVSITVINPPKPPIISIINPVTGSTFTAPANIPISVNASDADGTISKVEFFSGTTSLVTITSSPWSVTWNDVPSGTYSLTAIATDNTNLQTTSSPVSITVNNSPPATNQPPIISITDIVGDSIDFIPPGSVTIAANASDPDGQVTKVEFLNGIQKLGEKTSEPWSFEWNDIPAGTYPLTAVATDNLGAKTTSSVVSLTIESAPVINQAPSVSIVNPSDGQIFNKYEDIIIDAFASDLDGSISKVEFYSGNIKLTELTSAPYSYKWKYADEGLYAISAVATDNLNMATVSSPIWIEVKAGSNAPSVNSKILNLWPNPNNGKFEIALIDPEKNGNSIINIITPDGRSIYKGFMLQEEITKQFDFSFIKPGVYVLILLNSFKIIETIKFVKQ